MGPLHQGSLYSLLSSSVIEGNVNNEQNHNGSYLHFDRKVDISCRGRIQYDVNVDPLYLDMDSFLLCGIRLLL